MPVFVFRRPGRYLSLPLKQRDTCHWQMRTFLCVTFSPQSLFLSRLALQAIEGQEGFGARPGAPSVPTVPKPQQAKEAKARASESSWKNPFLAARMEPALEDGLPAAVNQQCFTSALDELSLCPEREQKHFLPLSHTSFANQPLPLCTVFLVPLPNLQLLLLLPINLFPFLFPGSHQSLCDAFVFQLEASDAQALHPLHCGRACVRG